MLLNVNSSIAFSLEDRDEIIRTFLTSDSPNLFVISEHQSDTLITVTNVLVKLQAPCKIIINSQGKTTIVNPLCKEDSIKVIYSRPRMDNFGKALLSEYAMPIAFFD